MDAEQLIGRRSGPSAWRVLGQEQIDAFAALSGDRQWIHVDVERAKRESPYGGTIAHGNLTLALIDGIRDELQFLDGAIGVNYGYERVRFPAPVPAGARLRGSSETIDAELRPDGWWRILQRFTVELEGGSKPACVADSVVLVRMLEE